MLTSTRVFIASAEALSDAAIFERIYRNADDERRQKVDRLPDPERRRQSLAAGALLREALLQCGLGGTRIIREESGRLRLQDDVAFVSLAHSGERVLCAVSPKEVGCDLERGSERLLAIAERRFSGEEIALIAATEGSRREALALRLWTLKESVCKATGQGLSMGLSATTFHFDGDGAAHLPNSDFRFREFDAADGFHIAVCARTPIGALEELPIR